MSASRVRPIAPCKTAGTSAPSNGAGFETEADAAAGGAAGLLRRRRPRDPHRRARHREIRPADLCAPRDRPQPTVVERLEKLGAVFIEELTEAPDGARVIFSAHGVPKSVPQEAQRRKLFYLDATCPLVSKVHVEAERHHRAGHTIILIGHAGHPEVIGTMGQLPDGAVVLVETVGDVGRLSFPRRHAARLHHADDAVGRRHGADRCGVEEALPGHRRAAQGRHLLRDDQPAGSDQGDRAAAPMSCW